MDQARAAWVALALTPGIGPTRLHALLSVCHTPLGAISAPFELLRTIPGMTIAAATALAATDPESGRIAIECTERLGGRVVIPSDPEYPDLLRPIAEPPPVLFALGKVELVARPAAAIVGSRNHTPYGGEVSRLVGWHTAAAGVVVVSGMARGLDAVAHAAALDAGGGTIGVLGNGLGVVYPAANRRLYDRVAGEGLLLTEFPPGERPNAGSFPRRNRIISGLARVTVVVEAAIGSGALITADCALDQGREVMAVPGPIISPQSAGVNQLIRDGAQPLLEPTDLLAHFPDAVPPAAPPPLPAGLAPLPEDLGQTEYALAHLLGADSMSLDQLVGRSGLQPAQVLAALSSLEIAGVVEQEPGGRIRRREARGR